MKLLHKCPLCTQMQVVCWNPTRGIFIFGDIRYSWKAGGRTRTDRLFSTYSVYAEINSLFSDLMILSLKTGRQEVRTARSHRELYCLLVCFQNPNEQGLQGQKESDLIFCFVCIFRVILTRHFLNRKIGDRVDKTTEILQR